MQSVTERGSKRTFQSIGGFQCAMEAVGCPKDALQGSDWKVRFGLKGDGLKGSLWASLSHRLHLLDKAKHLSYWDEGGCNRLNTTKTGFTGPQYNWQINLLKFFNNMILRYYWKAALLRIYSCQPCCQSAWHQQLLFLDIPYRTCLE